jgi:hypothetical protein
MKLYHSSTEVVKVPDINHSREYLDFGRGFYLTTIYEQAVKYAQRFIRRKKAACLNVYDFDFNPTDWNILIFDTYSREWLDFVVKCRGGLPTDNYDLVIGGIANDKVIETLNLFFDNILSTEETLGRLKYEKPNIQYCIRSQKMLDECLNFVQSVKL